jgi:hypothetical protein
MDRLGSPDLRRPARIASAMLDEFVVLHSSHAVTAMASGSGLSGHYGSRIKAGPGSTKQISEVAAMSLRGPRLPTWAMHQSRQLYMST